MKNKNKRILISTSLILVVILFYGFTVYHRTKVGYFSNPMWIFVDGIAWMLMFGMVGGIVIANIVQKVKK